MRLFSIALVFPVCLLTAVTSAQSAKPPISFDEYLNTTAITEARISPDGSAAVIGTETPDWKNSIYRHDLWLWTAQAGLRSLTHSGSEEKAAWSPDGKWIAFVTDRALPGEAASEGGEPESSDAKADRVWVIPVSGGEALPLYREKLDAHAFAWSPDGAAIYFSVTEPLSHGQQEARKDEWKDVIRWREQHRGDLVVKLAVAPALARAVAVEPPPTKTAADSKAADAKSKGKEEASSLPAGAETIARSALEIGEIAPSPDGTTVAFTTEPPHHRVEKIADYEIFLVAAAGGEARQSTNNEGIESELRWSLDSQWLYFAVKAAAGSV